MDPRARVDIGAELIRFFNWYEEKGFPANWEEEAEAASITLSANTKQLLKSGNTTEIGKVVDLGLDKPMIFWPPGGM